MLYEFSEPWLHGDLDEGSKSRKFLREIRIVRNKTELSFHASSYIFFVIVYVDWFVLRQQLDFVWHEGEDWGIKADRKI